MGERIIQPPFYNSGFYNTGSGGGGGGNGFFNCDVAFGPNTAIMKSEDKIRTYYSGGASTGGFVICENLYNANIKDIVLNLKFYRAAGGGTERVVGYNSTNSSYTNGRLFTIESEWSTGNVIFQTASSNTSWSTFTYTSDSGSSMKNFDVEVKKNGMSLNIKLYINGVKKHDANSTDFTNGHWQPNFFTENNYSNVVPNYWGFKPGEYMVMSESSLYIDDKKIFGS